MFKCKLTILYVSVLVWSCDNARTEIKTSLLPGKGVLNAIPEFLLHSATESTAKTEATTTEMDDYQVNSLSELTLESNQIDYVSIVYYVNDIFCMVPFDC